MRVTPVEILKSAFVSGKGASRIAVTYDVNGTNLVTEPVCGTPVSSAGNWAFTATGDTIKLYFGDMEEVYGYFGP